MIDSNASEGPKNGFKRIVLFNFSTCVVSATVRQVFCMSFFENWCAGACLR